MTPRGWFARQPTWRRRLLGGITAYVLLVVVLQALGLAPSLPLVAVLLVAGMTVTGYVGDRLGDSAPHPWPTSGVSTVGIGRGADPRAMSTARRLAGARETDAGGRARLAADLHAQLVAVVVDAVLRREGHDLRTEPDAALTLLHPELADLVLCPPDERQLTDPASLTRLLDRIELL